MIKKQGSQYVLYNHTGKKVLGRFSSKAAAVKREQQINYFKHVEIDTVTYDELKTLILDRYSVDELIEVLGIDVSDILEAFEDRVIEKREVLDVVQEV